MSIFIANNASRISKLTSKQNAMVVRFLDWNCNISYLVISLSKGLILELGAVVGLRVGLGQSTSMELRELGKLRPITIVPSLPSTKYCLHLSMFLVA
jgi:hypothetical protein